MNTISLSGGLFNLPPTHNNSLSFNLNWIEFTNPLIKNDFMRNLNKLKGAPTNLKNVSIKYDMTPGERSKERQLHPKTKLNNEIQNDDSKSRFYVVWGPIWDRKIVKAIKQRK